MNLSPARHRWLGCATAVTVATVPIAFAACSSSEFSTTDPEDQGNYSASVIAGTDTLELSGRAVFGTTQSSLDFPVNAVYLLTGDPPTPPYDVIWFQRRNLDLLEPGDYTIADVEGNDLPPDSDFLALYAFADDEAWATFHSVTGILTITTAEGLELTGTFEITGALALDESYAGAVPDTVLVSGTFRAVPGSIN